eukprot:2549643-Pleurochrysis_carterae.AAC.3
MPLSIRRRAVQCTGAESRVLSHVMLRHSNQLSELSHSFPTPLSPNTPTIQLTVVLVLVLRVSTARPRRTKISLSRCRDRPPPASLSAYVCTVPHHSPMPYAGGLRSFIGCSVKESRQTHHS